MSGQTNKGAYQRNPMQNASRGMLDAYRAAITGASSAQPLNMDRTRNITDIMPYLEGTVAAGGSGRGADYMAAYSNPYTQDVVNTTNDEIVRRHNIQMLQNDSAADAASAFGGSRHGLVAAEGHRGLLDTLARNTAALNSDGFNVAVGAGMADADRNLGQTQLAGQLADSEANRRLAGAGQSANSANNLAQTLAMLSGQSFDMGNQVNANLRDDGQYMRGIQQAVIDSGRDMFERYTSQPEQLLNLRLQSLGINPLAGQAGQTTTTSREAGMSGILGALLQAYALGR